MTTPGIPTSSTAADVRLTPAASSWRVFSVLMAIQFLMIVDTSIVYVALPSMAADLKFGPAEVGWVMDAFMLTLGGFLLVAGKVADQVGRRRLLVIGLVLFAAASLFAALAWSPGSLIAARGLQGLAAAAVTPAAMALVVDTFPPGPDRIKALGLFGGVGGVAGASGSVIGGLLSSVSWQAVFYVNLPVILVILLVGVRLLPNTAHPSHGRADIVGAVLLVTGISTLLFVIIQSGATGSFGPLVPAAIAAVALVGFAVRQAKASDPLVPRALTGNRTIMRGNVVNVGVGALMFGEFFTITLFLQQARGLGPVSAAWLILPVSVSLFIGSQVAIAWIRTGGALPVLRSSLLIQVVANGFLAWHLPTDDGTSLLAYLVPGCLWGLGLGMSVVAAFVACTHGLFGPMQGVAAGLVNTTLQLGGAVGVALMSIPLVAQDGAGRGLRLAFAVAVGIAVAGLGASLLMTKPPEQASGQTPAHP